MNAPQSSQRKPDRDDDKKRQEETRRQFRFTISYLLSSLVALWLFQLFVVAPLTRGTELEQYERAQALLKNHHAALKTLAQELLKQETVSGSSVKAALKSAATGP